jgi:hypothetical protein
MAAAALAAVAAMVRAMCAGGGAMKDCSRYVCNSMHFKSGCCRSSAEGGCEGCGVELDTDAISVASSSSSSAPTAARPSVDAELHSSCCAASLSAKE